MLVMIPHMVRLTSPSPSFRCPLEWQWISRHGRPEGPSKATIFRTGSLFQEAR